MDFETPARFLPTASKHSNDQHHSSGAPMCPIRCSDACECLPLLTWCFSLFPPPLQCADTGLLSNPRAAYGAHTLIRVDTHAHTWKTQELWRRKIMYSHSTSPCSVTPKNVTRNSERLRLDEIQASDRSPATAPLGNTHTHESMSTWSPLHP